MSHRPDAAFDATGDAYLLMRLQFRNAEHHIALQDVFAQQVNMPPTGMALLCTPVIIV
jgi:hypothetical protein